MKAELLAAAIGDSSTARWFRAPGRVNLIGDHTDYNEGFVLPVAIDLDCVIASRLTRGRRIHITSIERPGEEVDIAADGSDEPSKVEPEWGRLVAAIVRALSRRGCSSMGIVAAISSSLPIGSGLSSSAAMEVACALALLDGASRSLERLEIAQTCREAEEEATGVPCGIMDQATSLFGRAGHALLIDCRSLDIELIPLPGSLSVFAVHCGVSRALAQTPYADRRRACERSAAALGLGSLRDAALEQVFDDPLARHVVTENLRVIVTARALRNSEDETIAQMFADSHRSLRDDYQVSTPELDALVTSVTAAGALGARLTGAGFGGCIVAVAEAAAAPTIARRALADYRQQTGLEPTLFWCHAADGAGPIRPERIAG